MQIAKYWRNKKLRYRLIRGPRPKKKQHVVLRGRAQTGPPPSPRKIAEPAA